ncbi:MAG: phosphodiester glycosidase family protein [Acidobacteria bacterium]|nr:phosphodiester glycosidase family protein [Acidobacteriota bacterium]
MKFRRFSGYLVVVLLVLGGDLHAQGWEEIKPGISYREYTQPGRAIYVTRIDLTTPTIDLIASAEIDRGLTVDEFAERYDTVVAINGDYFNQQLQPIGPALSSCGAWGNAKAGRTEIVVAIGSERAEIYRPSSREAPLPSWVEDAVAGWPMLVDGCKSLSTSLPGSASFTMAPHPRTAVGLSGDQKLIYFVVADGRREDAPGMTLPQLADFMHEELGVCTAVNLDGGGSSQMVVGDDTVNVPSDGVPRRVANHLAVVPANLDLECEVRQELVAAASAALRGTWERVAALEKKLKAGNATVDERIELARMYLDRSRFWEAKQVADEILSNRDHDLAARISAEAQVELSRLSSDKGESPSDSKEAEAATAVEPIELARSYIERERFWEAREIADEILSAGPNPEAEEVRAAAEAGLKRLSEGKIAEARRAASAPGATLEDRIALADLLFSDGQYGEAIAIYSDVPRQRRDRELRLRHARALAWSGRLDPAEVIYHELLAEQPTPELTLEYARLLSWMGATRAAIGHLRPLYEEAPRDEVAVALANALAWQGKRSEAVALLERHTTQSPSVETQALLAELRASPELRLERIEEAIADEPFNLSLRIARARLLIEAERYSAALEDLEFVDRHSRERHDEVEELMTLASESRRRELESLETEVVAVDPRTVEDPDRLRELARKAAGLSRYDEAIELYEAYLERRPDDTEVRIDYAKVLGWDRRYDQAIREYEAILAKNPERLDLRLEYARLLSWDERYYRAVRELDQLTDISDHPRPYLYTEVPAEARFSLGQIYRWFGWHEHAMEQQQFALGLDGGFEPAATELEMVQRLRPASVYDGRYTRAETASDFVLDRLDFITQQWLSRKTAVEGLVGWHQFRQAGLEAEALSIGVGVRHRLQDQLSARARIGINRYDDDTRWFGSVAGEWLPSLTSRFVAELSHYDLIYDVFTLRSLGDDPLSITDLSLHYDHDTGGRLAYIADASFGNISDDNKRLALHGLVSFELRNDPFVAVKADYRHLQYDFRTNRYWSPSDYHSLAGVVHVGDNVREKFFWDAELKYGRSWQEGDSHDLQSISLRGTVPITEGIDLVAAYTYGRSGRIDEPFASPDLVTYWQRRWYIGFRLRNLFRGDDRDAGRRYYFDEGTLEQDPALPQFGEEG